MKITDEWISGFVDGDGSFSVQKIEKGERIRHRFIVSQDQRSADVLYALKKRFGCGSVHKTRGDKDKVPRDMMTFEISNPLHLRDKCIPLFQKCPLQTKKKYSFYKFAISLWTYIKEQGDDPGSSPLPPKAGYQLSAGWFRGFVDADGSFSLVILANNQIEHRFLLGAQGDADLILECQKLIKCGARWSRGDGVEMLQVSAIDDLEKRLFPFFETRGSAVLLRTMKRISFQKFRKIIRLMVLGRHHTPEGMEKIKKLQLNLNKFTPQKGKKILLENSLA